MKKILLVIIGISIFSNVFTQELPCLPQGKNSVYGDILVLIFINNFQVNYERTVYLGENISTSVRIGIGSWTEWDYNGISFPIDVHLLFIKYNIHPEINFGLISFYDNDASSLSKPELLYGIGIRYQNDLKGGFVRF
ncbi:MAG: hypothetical protein PHW83_12935, partial [Bacteroidales bacterium]|nr:hypothetical protein [Bacteroidales bacterium]